MPAMQGFGNTEQYLLFRAHQVERKNLTKWQNLLLRCFSLKLTVVKTLLSNHGSSRLRRHFLLLISHT